MTKNGSMIKLVPTLARKIQIDWILVSPYFKIYERVIGTILVRAQTLSSKNGYMIKLVPTLARKIQIDWI
jgi:hypothetical protein